jgi:hypothetical protein
MLLLDPEDGSIMASGISYAYYFPETEKPNFFVTDSSPPVIILQGSMAFNIWGVSGTYLSKFVMN